ncbi:hypothetical protein KC320_g81 [Hortaea werneckii]|nr:hypothetical protein KC320_g81 [Hortaea werneckii]
MVPLALSPPLTWVAGEDGLAVPLGMVPFLLEVLPPVEPATPAVPFMPAGRVDAAVAALVAEEESSGYVKTETSSVDAGREDVGVSSGRLKWLVRKRSPRMCRGPRRKWRAVGFGAGVLWTAWNVVLGWSAAATAVERVAELTISGDVPGPTRSVRASARVAKVAGRRMAVFMAGIVGGRFPSETVEAKGRLERWLPGTIGTTQPRQVSPWRAAGYPQS